MFFCVQNSLRELFDVLVTDYRDALDLEENWDECIPDRMGITDGTHTLLGLAFAFLGDDNSEHIAKRLLEEGAVVYHTLLADVIKHPSAEKACGNYDAVANKVRGKALMLEWIEAHPGCVQAWPNVTEHSDPMQDGNWCMATTEDRDLFTKLWK